MLVLHLALFGAMIVLHLELFGAASGGLLSHAAIVLFGAMRPSCSSGPAGPHPHLSHAAIVLFGARSRPSRRSSRWTSICVFDGVRGSIKCSCYCSCSCCSCSCSCSCYCSCSCSCNRRHSDPLKTHWDPTKAHRAYGGPSGLCPRSEGHDGRTKGFPMAVRPPKPNKKKRKRKKNKNLVAVGTL